MSLTARVALLAAGLWLCLGPAGQALLDALVPVQRAAFGALMPAFETRSFGVERRGSHLKLRATSMNREYLVIQGQAVAPGFDFAAETPARSGLLYLALVWCGAAIALPAGRRGLLAGAAVAAPLALALLVAAVPVTLAGELYGLGVTAFGEASLEALLVAASGFLLHGGGFALCLAAVWAAAAVARRPG
jgi:hypothetical protein